MTKRLLGCILSLALLLNLAGCVGGPNPVLRKHTAVVFGSEIVISIEVLAVDADQIITEMTDAVTAIDDAVSITKDTPLRAFNQSQQVDVPFEVNQMTFDMVSTALEIWEMTDNAYNIAITPLSALWYVDPAGLATYGLDTDLNFPSISLSPDSLPTIEQVNQVLPSTDLAHLSLSTSEGKYFLTKSIPALQLDLGSIAKGYAADVCRDIAAANNAEYAIIDISGNLYLYGTYRNSKGVVGDFPIGIANPRFFHESYANLKVDNSTYNICAVNVDDASIVTSGDYHRLVCFDYGAPGAEYFFDELVDPVLIPHIINPRTGLPMGVEISGGRYANSSDHIISVSIIHQSSMMADALTTAVCILGVQDGTALLNQLGLGAVIFTEDGRCITTGAVQFVLTDAYSHYQTYELIEL